MKQVRAMFIVAGVTGLASLSGMSIALADDTVCIGRLGAITVDNVVVPDGKRCTLRGTRVEGNVFVYTNATLNASRVRVDGNIQAEGAAAVYVNPGSVVGGNIQIKQGGAARIKEVRIDGDLQFEENNRALRAIDNQIGGNLQAWKNTGGLTIAYNVIAENLQCKENTPPPQGRDNVAGDKEDQCRNL